MTNKIQALINLQKEINEKLQEAQKLLKYFKTQYNQEFSVFVAADGTANNLTSKFVTYIYFTIDDKLITQYEKEYVAEFLELKEKLKEMEKNILKEGQEN